MGADERDEAIGRLGGPSRITELELKLDKKIDELEQAIKRNRVQVGREVYMAPGPTANWHDSLGALQTPPETCRIEGIGPDWCVVRSETTGDLYYSVRARTDIRATLADDVID